MATEPTDKEARARLKLRGARFDEGRIPVSALEEIQRYQRLIVAAAMDAWRDANDEETVPEDLVDELSFDLVGVEKGCAIAVLEPEASVHEDLLQQSQERVDELFRQLVGGDQLLSTIPTWADTKDFWELGSSLQEGESLELRPNNEHPVELGAAFFAERAAHTRTASIRHEKNARLTGRLVMLDAGRQKYALETLAFGRIEGRYKSPDLTSDLHAALASSDSAPIVWITGKLKYKGARPHFFLQTDSMQALPAGDESWLPRLAEIAQLEPNWSEDSEGEIISPSALIAAAGLLGKVADASDRAAIFPTHEGGVLVEWATADQVVNVEFLANGSFDLLYVPKGAPAVFKAGVKSFDQAQEFVLERLAVK